MRNLGGKTKILGIIGHPVGHSLSPAMQNAALTACGLDYIYVPFEVHPDMLAVAVHGLRALGVAGFNVTIPHKTAIAPHLDCLDESAEAAGAVNTVLNDGGRLIGYNTDGDGLVRSLAEDLDVVPGAGTIILLGAGGAARGAVAALCRAGAKRIVIVNRTSEKACELATALGKRYPATELSTPGSLNELRSCLEAAVLLVNTTSAGMNHDRISLISLRDLPATIKVYDMVYAPQVTPLLMDARARGLRCVNGLGMLSGQGELAFRIWTGREPPHGVMKEVLASICNV
jgi:shikimate dehydrogenase